MAYAGAAHLPESWRRVAPPVFGSAFWAALPRVRRVVTDNQARILSLPRGSFAARRAAHALFVEYAHCLTDSLELTAKPDRPFPHRILGREHMVDARREGRGVVVVTAHTGSWEVGGRCLSEDQAMNVTLVMAAEENVGTRGYASELRRRAGTEVVYADGHDPGTALTLLARLRELGAVAVQLDRAPPSNTPVDVTMFGANWALPRGPFRLAQAAGAPVIPIFIHRVGYRTYEVVVDPAIAVPRKGGPDAVASAARSAAASLERFVRAHPDQWFHFQPIPAAGPVFL